MQRISYFLFHIRHNRRRRCLRFFETRVIDRPTAAIVLFLRNPFFNRLNFYFVSNPLTIVRLRPTSPARAKFVFPSSAPTKLSKCTETTYSFGGVYRDMASNSQPLDDRIDTELHARYLRSLVYRKAK